MITKIIAELSKIKNHYKKRGLWSLVSIGPRYLFYSLFAYFIPPLTRSQLLEQSDEQGNCWFITQKGEEYFFPSNHGECEFLKPVGRFTQPVAFVSEVQNCKILGEEPTFITNDNQLILELAKDDNYVLRKRCRNINIKDIFEIFTNGYKRHELVFPLVRYNHQTSYYHWWMEELSTLRKLEHYQNKTGEEPTILIESDPPDWVVESIELLGFDGNDLIEYPKQPIICDNLVVPSYNHHAPNDFRPDRADYCWLKNAAISNLSGKNDGTVYDRIFISRTSAENREVINRSAVMDVLKPLGFTLVELESLSVEDQIRLFNNADIVIGPHGAGFTNMLFSDNGTFIEFIPRTREFAFFRNLSQTMDVDYDCILCENVNENDDMIVPIQNLKTILGRYTTNEMV